MSDPNAQPPHLPKGGYVANNVVGTPPVLPQGGGTGGASTSHQSRGDGVESSDSEDEEFDDARSNRSARRPSSSSSRDYTQTFFDYSCLSFNHPSSSHIGKIPQFDGTGYSKWKNSMEEYLMAVNPALWTIVNRGITFPSGDATLTQDQANEI
jgi:hypothetical protein